MSFEYYSLILDIQSSNFEILLIDINSDLVHKLLSNKPDRLIKNLVYRVESHYQVFNCIAMSPWSSFDGIVVAELL